MKTKPKLYMVLNASVRGRFRSDKLRGECHELRKYSIIFILLLALILQSCGLFIGKDFAKRSSSKSFLPNFGTLFLSAVSGDSSGASPVPHNMFLYQLNPELIARVGDFFTLDHSSLPQPFEFTDVAAARVPSLTKSLGIVSSDANIFILDGLTGIVFVTQNGNNMISVKNADFLGAKKIAVTEKGMIALLTKNGDINLCWNYDGSILAKKDKCTTAVSAENFQDIVAYDANLFLAYSATGGLKSIGSDAATSAVASPITIEDYASMWASPARIIIADQIGSRVFSFEPATGKVTVRNEKIAIGGGPVQLAGIAPLPGGGYLGASTAFNRILFLDENLEVVAGGGMPAGPYPFRYIFKPEGVIVDLENGVFGVWSGKALNMYAVGDGVGNDYSYLAPPALNGLDDILTEEYVVSAIKANPQVNLLDLPEVKNYLKNVRGAR